MRIVDYGAGNLPSVERALQKLGVETEIATQPNKSPSAKVIVLPGVGHFSAFREGFAKGQLDANRFERVSRPARPFLEFALACRRCSHRARKLPAKRAGVSSRRSPRASENVKSPHIGWNQLGVRNRASYCAAFRMTRISISRILMRRPLRPNRRWRHAITDIPFAAVIERAQLMGVQFHPEKSGEVGAASV